MKQIPPNSLQHLNFEDKMENQKERKLETEHIKIPKSRVSDMQKMKQSKLTNVTYFRVGRKSLYFLSVLVPVWRTWAVTAEGLLESHLDGNVEQHCVTDMP